MRRIVLTGLVTLALLATGAQFAAAQDLRDRLKDLMQEQHEAEEARRARQREQRRKSLRRHPWAVSADGAMVAAATNDGRIEIWAVPQPAPVLVLDGHPEFLVDDLDFDSARNRITSLGEDGLVRTWELESGELAYELGEKRRGTILRYRSVAHAPDGRHSVFRTSMYCSLLAADTAEWLEARLYGSPYQVKFLANSDFAVTTSEKGVELYDLTLPFRPYGEGRKTLARPVWQLKSGRRMGFSTSEEENELEGALTLNVTVHDASDSLVVAATGLSSAGWDRKLSCWNTKSRKRRWETEPSEERVRVFEARDAKYISVMFDGELRFLNPRNGRVSKRRRYPSDGPRPQILTPDGSLGFDATDEGELVILPAISSRVPKPPEEPAPAEDPSKTDDAEGD